MHLTHYKTTPTGDTVITFPRLECWNAKTKVATVAADVNKRRVLCRIPLTLLRERFGATPEEPMQAVTTHRLVIQEAARRLIETESFEEDGSVLIGAQDI
ncbi:DUF1488 domain-containing protein [Sedimenticola thiotaurini]|uniref:DUF1488 domain-containing protein n=1 Tax=Sedimenticola thiotaurini TaxID=1543721 RepID=A0A0F7K1L9_9GAMM|nr:DUF1488 domain-containing protein [Sedimenticola thiotaurini]AKH21469.1 hypothetical protein AAY24_15170 [Sedimenticola thiotaurini]